MNTAELRKIVAAESERTGRMLRPVYTHSGKPSGSYRWQSRHYIRLYLVDQDGRTPRMPDGSYTVWASSTYLRNINGNIRVADRDYVEDVNSWLDELCLSVGHTVIVN